MLRLLASCRRLPSASPSRAYATIDPSKLEVHLTAAPKPKVAKETLAFGAVKSDHMLEIDWDHKQGQLTVQGFEGMKAYVDSNDRARLFRPDMNMKRLSSSMERLSFPALNQDAFLQCIRKFVQVEKSWIPRGEGYSLYLRPTVLGTWPYLGVHAAHTVKLFVIACPVGPYYPEGFKPVKLLADKEHVRAWPGGCGNAKIGGNYAPTIRVQAEAAALGYTQVLWLFGDAGEVTEVGTMNFFVFWVNAATGRRELRTPPLDGTILPGVTRDSILQLARGWQQGGADGGFDVVEGKFTIHEVVAAAREGRLLEAFGAGTAAVVSPVKCLHYDGADYAVPLDPTDPAAGAGPLTRRFADSIAAIQYGKPGFEAHPWSVVLD